MCEMEKSILLLLGGHLVRGIIGSVSVSNDGAKTKSHNGQTSIFVFICFCFNEKIKFAEFF